MDSTKQHLEERQVQTGGVASDLGRLHENSAATAAELRDFLGQLHDRSPQEVMGVVAQSNLFRSIFVAAGGCLALLLLLTIIPYLLKDQSAQVTAQPATKLQQPQSAAAAATVESASTEEAAAGDEPDLEKAAEAMGISDAADADPNSNPLDSKLDKLLDGVE